ncbi:MAG: energy transducer TonB [Cytophaga sp.]|uniref:energy transducer TonB n=1 Tax=Cytophaga sp. TaxID=29535 RepID=UPI003F80ACBA
MEKSFNQNDEPYVYVQVAAEYIDGGESKFIEYVTSYVKKNAAPQNDSAATVTGVLFVQYVIEKDGSVSTASIMPGEGINPAYDQAAIEAVKKSKWKPASNYGTPVRYKKINRFKFY